MDRVVRFLDAAVRDLGQRVVRASDEIFEVRGSSGERLLRFTTKRDLARNSEDVDLLGIDHSVVMEAIERWCSVRPEELGAAVQGPGQESGILTWWFVERSSGRGERRFCVQPLAVALNGRRMAAWEQLGDTLLGRATATPFLDGTTRAQMLVKQIEPMLQRELQHRGMGIEGGGVATKLIGWLEMRGKGASTG